MFVNLIFGHKLNLHAYELEIPYIIEYIVKLGIFLHLTGPIEVIFKLLTALGYLSCIATA